MKTTNKSKGVARGSLRRLVSQPRRIQLSRKKGAKLPANTVVVARPSKWGNPFKVSDIQSNHPGWTHAVCQNEAVRMYEGSICNTGGNMAGLLTASVKLVEIIAALRGKHLACWCKPGEPCHADVLLRLANS